MSDISSSTSDASLLLLLLGAAVAVLAAHVAFGWLRLAQRSGGPVRSQWVTLLVVGGVLGAGISASAALAMSAEGLPFPLGYRAWQVLALLLAGMAGSVVAAALLLRGSHPLWLCSGGVVLGLVALGVQLGWTQAAGFRPGLRWRPEFVVGAALLLTVCCAGAAWLGLNEEVRESRRSPSWRPGASLLLGIALLLGNAALYAGAGMQLQVGSIYRNQLPGSILSLVSGALVRSYM